MLAAFAAQFYAAHPPPSLVLLSHAIEDPDLLSEALTQASGHKVDFHIPLRGSKKRLMDSALANAREALARRQSEGAGQKRLLEDVAEAFGLERLPTRIEVYDNSHVQGAHSVGAMIVAGPEGFIKTAYRKFNIKNEDVYGDDFGMMREVMTRRFSRAMKEDPDRTGGNWPDLLLIDGGQGQLSAVSEILADLGISGVAMVGVAKGPDRNAGRERFFIEGRAPFSLPFSSPALYYLQRLRDEAHRFAIGTHRAKRAKALVSSPLDEVPGIGPKRKKALLLHFGSARAVSRAGLADLMAVEGISEAMARTLYSHFHEHG